MVEVGLVNVSVYLYINRGTYVPASVCRGEAAATRRSRGHGHAAKPRPCK